jgi:hypothetical protein
MTGRRHQLMSIPFAQPNNWEWYVVVIDRIAGLGGLSGPGNARLPVCFLGEVEKRYKGNVACRDAVFESGENWFAEARSTGA